MILFLNVFITDKRMSPISRGLAVHAYDRLDVFKYTLASYAEIPWEHVIILCELDEPYRDRKNELEAYVHQLFKNPDLRFERITHHRDWKKMTEKIFEFSSDGLVWFCCNDDQVFIDYELDLLNRLLSRMKALAETHPYVGLLFSHWPEALAYSAQKDRSPLPHEGMIEETSDYCLVDRMMMNDSILIVNLNWLKYLWMEEDYGDRWLARPDWVEGVRRVPTTCLIPYRELVRHYDAYAHTKIGIDACPPLAIPDGFFENDIKIRFGYKDRVSGTTLVNPLSQQNIFLDPHGADLKNLLEDLPLFWKKRISQIDIHEGLDSKALMEARDASILNLAKSKLVQYGPVDEVELAKRISIALCAKILDPGVPYATP
ncbi:MAG: hypothetical protein JWQ35_2522 [Bacteriovoracaceae bacterium]|nr:hypothetical protein [Bacteriovoracaceae bacterium]